MFVCGGKKMMGESCDYCETANVRLRQTDTTTLEVTDHWRDGKSKKLITVGIFACDDCYKQEVVSEFYLKNR